jgi:membrane fusion protein (multidrug efflux system)
MAEVLSGLEAGDQVVVEGVQSVRPGVPVQLAPATPSDAGAAEMPLRPRG